MVESHSKEELKEEGFQEYGHVPAQMLLEDEFDFPYWVEIMLNPETGDVAVVEVTDETVEKHENEYVEALVENEVVSKEEADEVLND